MSWDVKALASTTGTAPITPQIKNLIGRVRNNNRAARAGSPPQNDNVKKQQQREITAFTVLVTT